MMFAVSPQNDVVSLRTQTQKIKHFRRSALFFIQADRLGISLPKVYKAFATMIYNASHGVDFFLMP
jgi:hypothetical protein